MAVPIEGSLKVHRFQTLSWQHLVSANLSPQAEKSCQAVSSSRKKVSYRPAPVAVVEGQINQKEDGGKERPGCGGLGTGPHVLRGTR